MVVVLSACVTLALVACAPRTEGAAAASDPSAGATGSSPTATPVVATPSAEPTPTPAPMPDGPVATGQPATNGHFTVTVPDGYAQVKSYDGGLQFDGPQIDEAVLPDGTDPHLASNVGLFPIGVSWMSGQFEAGDPNVTQTVYSMSVPGADSVTFEFLSLDKAFSVELSNGGGTSWTGAQGLAVVWVVANGQVSGLHVSTHPGQAGIDFAASIARTITVG
ncbi:hypothetical protein CSO01_30710 [Cellulomonas soli]|uniref:Lipoprotein n=2 Tax=Cellulomonas soli TaxID=931535 RepID=A0A512PGN3_9CELL|nr:hypothetical protein CSO01_30710 [Cellulomonas soli]